MTATTARLYDYLWDRLNEQDETKLATLMPFPAPGSAVPHNNVRTDSQIGVIADRGIIPNTVNSQHFSVQDEHGNPVSGSFNMRTSLSSPTPRSHLIIFYPRQSLAPNTTYTVTLSADIKDENGLPLVPENGFQWQFEHLLAHLSN